MFQTREGREMQKMDRTAGLLSGAQAQQAQARADFMGAIGSGISAVAGIGAAAASAKKTTDALSPSSALSPPSALSPVSTLSPAGLAITTKMKSIQIPSVAPQGPVPYSYPSLVNNFETNN
jgi:hypothetical protein